MIIYKGLIVTESPSVELNETYVNPFNIPLQNTSEGVFKGRAQIGFFETKEASYDGANKLKVQGFDLSKQIVDLTILVTVENAKFVIDLYQVDLQIKEHLVNLGYDANLMTLTTEPTIE